MRFLFPRFPAQFEIPDDWWIEAGMSQFVPQQRQAYRSPTETVALDEIEPPFRTAPLDCNGFVRSRIMAILRGFVDDSELAPICLLVIPPRYEWPDNPFKYRVVDGAHRFYASIAAGFKRVPASTLDA
jgi:hypothetical protein